MDFFSAVRDGEQLSAPTGLPDVQVFANAVEQRYGTANIIRTRLTPVKEIIPPSMANISLAPSLPQRDESFLSVPPSDLPTYIQDSDTLIVDIRPHAAYSDARLPRALSLSVPSTLLKRPLFSLEKLSDMLPSPSHRSRFSAFRSSSRILVYDADAQSIPQSSNICGLLRKFKAASYSGELIWLRGGFQAVWREQRHLVDTGPPPTENDDDDDPDPSPVNSSPHSAVLRPGSLSMSAFTLPPPTVVNNASSINTSRIGNTSINKRRPYMAHHQSIPMHMSISMPPSMPSSRQTAANPFFDTIRQNIELSQGITERIPLRLPARVRRRINDLPFPWLQEIAKRADITPRTYNRHHHRHPLRSHSLRGTAHPHTQSSLSHHVTSSSEYSSFPDSSDSDAGPSPAYIEEGTEALAMQFYRIELAEQRRLMGVMEHHSKESGGELVDGKLPQTTHASLTFPFSITAGVEKGAKNRYRHIWPFEHARVRLQNVDSNDTGKHNSEIDDYVNASYIQPLGTNRRYIGTQGPLEATFEDFWRLTWQQNVHVIVMLTKEIEGGMVKCGTYWADTANPPPERSFGPLRLKLISKVGLPCGVDLMSDSKDAEAAIASTKDLITPGSNNTTNGGSGFGFAFPSYTSDPVPNNYNHYRSDKTPQRKKKRITTIKRTFLLTHTEYPHQTGRTIVHLQYLEWPDMTVPEDTRGVLELVREVERAVEETDQSASPVMSSPSVAENENKFGPGQKANWLAKTDAGSGIARHALGGCRPVLLHCSAGVGRTGGFIAVDAVLDAVRREMRMKKANERAEVNISKAEDAMDVDEPGLGMVTVPLHVSGSVAHGTNMDDDSGKGHGLVVHVPAVVVPNPTPSNSHTTEASAGVVDMRTPIPTDANDHSTMNSSYVGSEVAFTRKWAENVSMSYGATATLGNTARANLNSVQSQTSQSPPESSNFASLSVGVPSEPAPSDSSMRQRRQSQPQPQTHLHPLLHRSQLLRARGMDTLDTRKESSGSTTSSASASTLPSLSDSEDSRRVHRTHGGSGFSMFPIRDSSSFATSVSSLGSDKEKEEIEERQLREATLKQQKQNEVQLQGQRFRTVSAPQAQAQTQGRLKFSLGLDRSKGVNAESSPLARYGEEMQHHQDQQQFKAHALKSVPVPGGVVFPTIDDPSQTSPTHHSLSLTSPPLSAVRVDQLPPPPAYKSSHALPSNFVSRPATTVDYKEPRALHGEPTIPSPLSKFEEPIWEVVQDMREQRMSLCQSLRQYVFVHQVIIEGALWIVDEERQKEKDEEVQMERVKGMVTEGLGNDGEMLDAAVLAEAKLKQTDEKSAMSTSLEGFSLSFGPNKNALNGRSAQPGMSMAPPYAVRPSVPIYPLTQANSTPSGFVSDSGGSTTSSTGKRVASPTELLKEGRKGEVLLSKRPSIKRKLLSVSNEPTAVTSLQTSDTATSSPLPFR